MSTDEIQQLSSKEVQEYIFDHADGDEKELLLKHNSIVGIPTRLIAQQIAARKKAKLKLPLHYAQKGIVYPPTVNLEQSSSEATAKIKCDIVRKEIGEKAYGADLTGGFGIDSFFLSRITHSFDYVEQNAELMDIVRHNHALLKAKIRHYNTTAQDFLTSSKRFDFAFIDPSRRDYKARKVFSLSDCTPDIRQLLPLILKRTPFLLLKSSPLLDIKQGLKELTNVKEVIVVSVGNECKELLFLIQDGFAEEPLIETYDVKINGEIKQAFHFHFFNEEKAASKLGVPEKYLYEPNASILKSGGFKSVGTKFGLRKIHTNTHLYTSSVLQTDFPGRIFEIVQVNFSSKTWNNHKANIISRNFPMTAEEIKKKFKLKDGGEDYVIAFSGQDKKYMVLAKRLANT